VARQDLTPAPHGGLDEKVVVVAHQAVGVAEPAVPLDDGGEDGEEKFPVISSVIDHPPGVAAGGDVVDGAGEFDAQRAGHGVLLLVFQRSLPRKSGMARPDPSPSL